MVGVAPNALGCSTLPTRVLASLLVKWCGTSRSGATTSLPPTFAPSIPELRARNAEQFKPYALQVLRKAFKLAAKSSPPKIQLVPQSEMAVEDNTRMTFITEKDKQKLRDAASRDVGKKSAMMKGCASQVLRGIAVRFRMAQGRTHWSDCWQCQSRRELHSPRRLQEWRASGSTANAEPKGPVTGDHRGPITRRVPVPRLPVKDMRHAGNGSARLLESSAARQRAT